MSKSKSLGSSPIGYSSSGNERYDFIPDLGISPSNEEKSISTEASFFSENEKEKPKSNIHKLFSAPSAKSPEPKKKEKKIASYYIEENLIKRLKKLADDHGIYYSTFVSDAIEYWINEHDYDK